MYSLNQIPFFQELADSETILLAGAGGGFDIYSGIPLYFSLVNQGKKVILANYSFTWLSNTTSEKICPFCYQIRSGDGSFAQQDYVPGYFPEKYLHQWFAIQGHDVDIYAFERTGVKPLRDAYKFLIKKHNIDTVILVDGGTDSLMFGDEEGLGTPHEDICSMAAVYRSGIKKQFLLSIGFGVDHFHGVSHYRFLENVAEMAREGGYLGLFQLTKEMAEAEKYLDAIQYVNKRMDANQSIVSNSIASALEGHYGDYHRTPRTAGSELWINPLMTIYWAFDLRQVVRKIKYYDAVKDTQTMGEFSGKLGEYRGGLNWEEIRLKRQMPI